jgi:aromatic-L-amino-acid decarboxylase
MSHEAAETGRMQSLLRALGGGLDEFLRFEHPDALHPSRRWREALDRPLPRARASASTRSPTSCCTS